MDIISIALLFVETDKPFVFEPTWWTRINHESYKLSVSECESKDRKCLAKIIESADQKRLAIIFELV